jgi:hypothetical protein
MLIAERPLTSFIWKPDALSWIVGFLAGIAGMLALTSAKSGALVGVLISVTTREFQPVPTEGQQIIDEVSAGLSASAFSWRRPANRTCLPALTRRAIAWPIDPGPMTTMTLLMMMPFRTPPTWHQPLEHQVHTGLLQRTRHRPGLAGGTTPSDATTPAAGPPPPRSSTTDAHIPVVYRDGVLRAARSIAVPWPALAGLALARSVRLGARLTAALNQYRPDASGHAGHADIAR